MGYLIFINIYGRWKGGSRERGRVCLWLIHFDVWQKPAQYCKEGDFNMSQIKRGNNQKEYDRFEQHE